MVLDPAQGDRDDLGGVAMKFTHEGRQESECVPAAGAKEAPYGNRVRFCQGNKVAHVAPMPLQESDLFADLAVGGLGKLLIMKTPGVFVNLGFEQREILSGIGDAGQR
jgi:hypothetical protein